MTSLIDQFLGSNKVEEPKEPELKGSLTDTFLSQTKPSRKERLKSEAPQRKAEFKAFVQGLTDVINAGASAIGTIDQFFPGGKERKANFDARLKAENEAFNKANPPSEGLLPTTNEIARTAGQALATAPLIPAKGIQMLRGAMGALPTTAITGERVAAPLINKLGAETVAGGLMGAEFGALTSTSNDKSLTENVATGLITGALIAPALTGAAVAGSNVVPAIKNMWANVNINKLSRDAGLDPASVKNVVKILEDAGFTPQQAQVELTRLGPTATLSDLANSIATETSGLASLGGKATTITKNRFEARAQTANSEAARIMENKLGSKPNLEDERQAIVKQAQKEVRPDYEAAYVSGQKLDIKGIVSDIDKQLETAVGPKAQALKTIRSYLFKRTIDPTDTSKVVSVIKDDIASLHEVRMAIDDVIDKANNPTTSIGKRALSSIKDVRNTLDDLLKTNPQMAAADTKFAEKMTIKNAIDLGENVLARNGMNKEEFAKIYDNASPEIQDAIRKGMRGHLGDLMEKATRGELSEAQRLFGKSSLNRANLEKVFGNSGTEVLDALQKEATFRATEQAIRHGSQTAERQVVQRKYGERSDKPSDFGPIKGAILDVISGTPGGATALSTVSKLGSNTKLKLSDARKDRLIEGTADILSRQGADLKLPMDIATQVKSIVDKTAKKVKLKLPTILTPLLAAPIGQTGLSSYKRLRRDE